MPTISRSRVRNKKGQATAAFTSVLQTAHREPNLERTLRGRKPKRSPGRSSRQKKEEELWSKVLEENAPEENGPSNRQLSPAFIPPLTGLAVRHGSARLTGGLLEQPSPGP
jgi:hypothetical protein